MPKESLQVFQDLLRVTLSFAFIIVVPLIANGVIYQTRMTVFEQFSKYRVEI